MSHSETSWAAARTPLRQSALAACLRGTRWAEPEVHASIGSTNDEALSRPEPGRVVVADHQSTGRGRLSRSWSAPPGAALATSAVLPLPEDERCWGWVPLLVGVAVRDALAGQVDVGLKWPNDVLARRSPADPWRKVAGILCQTALRPQGNAVVIGVGLNVDLTEDELPVESATSLRLAGAAPQPREELVADLLGRLSDVEQAWRTGGSALEAAKVAYRQACVTLGQDVQVHLDGRVAQGRAVDVDDAGRLVLERDGRRRSYAVGDVVHVRPAEVTG